jgi:hypothetical protein
MTPLFPKEGTYEARAPVGTAKPQMYRKLITAFVAHAVCVNCNTGWMNGKIEIPAQRVGLGLMADRRRRQSDPPVRLPPTAQRAIATWATKVALLFPYTLKPPIPVEPERLRRFRTYARPPKGFYVQIGTYGPASGPYCSVWTSALTVNSQRLDVLTFHLGHIAFRVIEGPSSDPFMPLGPDPTFGGGPWFRIWPLSRRTLLWPRPAMTRELLEWFAGEIPVRS